MTCRYRARQTPQGFAQLHMLTTNPFDDDKLREECGIFGIWGADTASSFVALGYMSRCKTLAWA